MTTLRSLCAAGAALAVLLAPLPASAGPDAAIGTVEYQIWMQPTPTEAIVLVSTSLPARAPLPAAVRIPVPSGMQVKWAGEVSGADPSGDIERPHVIVPGVGGDYAEFTVEQFKQAQIDVSGKEIPAGASAVAVQFAFVQSVPTERSGFSVRVPRNAYDVGIDPLPVGEPAVNAAGESLYTLPSAQFKLGETAQVSVSYRIRSKARLVPGDPGGHWLPLALIGLAAVATAGALIYLVARASSRAGRR